MMTSYLATLALRVKKRLLHHPHRGALALMLDGHLHLERRADGEPRRAQMSERDVLLQQRRPAAGGRVADLLAAVVDRHAHAPGLLRQARGEPELAMETLERIPVHFDADETPLRIARRLGGQRFAPDEALLLQVHRPA